ncbi:MAG: 1-acyl-sn-glycerol-3-phosphate acyltransferase [Solirubrobacterales bacterium]|nr:1-acyl-sn-glycerol-3-phosphate acyltransferase [Solirubrobacterales bacterium]
MAEIKEQVYKDPRPAEYFDQFHQRARTKEPNWVYEATRAVMTLIGFLFYRTRAIGTENVPATGPVLLAPNHFSQMDHFFAGMYLRRRIRFMAKSQLFGPPVLTSIFTHGGVFPVRRGYADGEAFKTVKAIFEDQGGVVLVYAEGGRSRSGGLGEPRPGIGRIALENGGVPVVPVAIHGSAKVRKFRKLVFPKVTVQFGEPITFPAVPDSTREQQMEASNRVFDQVRAMYTGLEENGRRSVKKALREKLPVPEPGETINS